MAKKMTKETQMYAEMAMIYVLADMLEMQTINTCEICKHQGFQLRHELKRAIDKMTRGAKEFRGWTRREKAEQQMMIGTCSDVFLQFLKLMVDRTEEDADMFKIYNLVKNSIPSKRNWDLAETEMRAFEDILNK